VVSPAVVPGLCGGNMTDITRFWTESEQNIESLIAEAETALREPDRGNGLEPGTPVSHVDYPDFRGVVVGPGKDGKVRVKVIGGWCGGIPPTWPVSIPVAKLEVL